MDVLARSRQFLAVNGRDIDRARFAYHFDGGPLEELVAVLERYQNPDGGFGHGLEVDIAAPHSNPFATSLALQVCLQAAVGRDTSLLQRTVGYLEDTQTEDGDWRFTPEIFEHDLAPWFQAWEFPALNPACVIAGALIELDLGSDRLHAGVKRLFDRLARVEDLLGDEFYALQPYAFYFMADWKHPQRELYRWGVVWWLVRQHLEGKLADAGHFFEYVRNPRTFAGRAIPRGILDAELDRLASEQAEDGGWPTPYDARWRGPATVNSLLVLRAFDRI